MNHSETFEPFCKKEELGLGLGFYFNFANSNKKNKTLHLNFIRRNSNLGLEFDIQTMRESKDHRVMQSLNCTTMKIKPGRVVSWY